MTSIDPTSTQEETAAPPVPVKHPRWCDRSQCTAPEFIPTEYVDKPGRHRSVNLNDGVGGYHGCEGASSREFDLYLEQDVQAYENTTYLCVDDHVLLSLSGYQPLIWMILDDYAEKRKTQWRTPKELRAIAMKSLAKAKETRS